MGSKADLMGVLSSESWESGLEPGSDPSALYERVLYIVVLVMLVVVWVKKDSSVGGSVITGARMK